MNDTYEVVGMSYGTFNDKQTGNLIRYASIHVIGDFKTASEGSDYHTQGKKTFTFKCVAPDVFAEVSVGDEVTLFFDQYGKVSYIKPAA